MHDLRRACASRLLSQDVPADDVARQLGHASSNLGLTLTYAEAARTERALNAFHAADAAARTPRGKRRVG